MENEECNVQKLSVSGFKWKLKNINDVSLKSIEKKNSVPYIFKNILSKRELYSLDIDDYLNPTLKKFTPDPFTLHNMREAVELLIEAILNNKKIGILGDYDVDGASSSALIFDYLNDINVQDIEVFIPDRESDGYGFSKNALNFFLKKKIDIIICLDCGTNDVINVKSAQSSGLKVLIIDHHEQKKENSALALINPKQHIDKSGLNYMATVGLTFLFVVGLNSKLREVLFFSEKKKEPELKKYLDLVALGTICDLVPLKIVNRLFIKKGISEIKKKKNTGINTLLNKLNLKENINTEEISFYIGPCINAPGRVGESSLGFKILSNKYQSLYSEIALKLLRNNQERKTLEDIILNQAKFKMKLLKSENKKNFLKFIMLYDKSWHPGIIGIIASRLTKEFKVPSIIVSLKKNNVKASVRSIKGVDASILIDFLNKNDCIISGGGHSMAGGFTLKENKINDLNDLLNKYFDKKIIKNNHLLEYDSVIELNALSISLVEKVKEIGPFGQENEEPIIVVNDIKPRFIKTVGKLNNHIFCILEDIYGDTVSAIAFNHINTNIGKAIFSKQKISVAGKLDIYKSENKKIPQLVIEDILIL